MPLVSVVITLYNGAEYVADCIESVLGQTYQHFEVVVADDASSDNSLEVVSKFDDPRIRVLPPVDRQLGLHGNWARAYEAASGTYVKHVCHDDLLEPRCLELQVAMLEAHPDAAIACGRRRIIDDRGATIVSAKGIGPLASADSPRVVSGDGLVRACVRAGTNLLGEPASVLVRRSMLPSPLFDPRWSYTIDVEFDLRVASGASAVVDRRVVASFRVSASQLSSVLAESQARELRKLFRELRGRHPGTLTRLDIIEGNVRSLFHARARRVVYRVLALRRALAARS